jgi:hypothetical protein
MESSMRIVSKPFAAKVGIIGVILVGMTLAVLSSPTARERARHIYITSNDHFRIRVQMFPEWHRDSFVSGATYLFEAAAADSDDWIEIMNYKSDDPDPIHCDWIRFVDDTKAYLFMPHEFAVTTDGGRTWKHWDTLHWAANKQYPESIMILDAQIAADGSGKLILRVENDAKLNLFTNDYGAHWSATLRQ